MAKKRVSLLFCSVGRRVELLRAFHRAFEKLDVERHIVAVDFDPLAPALREADKPYTVPPIDSDEYVPTLMNICRREQVDIVFPYIEPEVAILGQHRDQIESTGSRLTGVSNSALDTVCDKWLTTQFFRKIGLTTPLTWLPDDDSVQGLRFPLFIKPRRGSASKDTYILNHVSELEFFRNYVPNPIIQQLIDGPELTTDLVCDLDGKVLTVVPRRRLAVRAGEIAKGVTVEHEEVSQACIKIAEGLGVIGPISVQCIFKDDVPCFTEVNARFGGGFPLSVAAGADSPYLLLARTAGIPVELPAYNDYRVGVYMTRFDQSLFLNEDEHAKVQSYNS